MITTCASGQQGHPPYGPCIARMSLCGGHAPHAGQEGNGRAEIPQRRVPLWPGTPRRGQIATRRSRCSVPMLLMARCAEKQPATPSLRAHPPPPPQRSTTHARPPPPLPHTAQPPPSPPPGTDPQPQPHRNHRIHRRHRNNPPHHTSLRPSPLRPPRISAEATRRDPNPARVAQRWLLGRGGRKEEKKSPVLSLPSSYMVISS